MTKNRICESILSVLNETDNMSVEKAVNEVSNDYGIDYNKETPFDDYGSSEDSENGVLNDYVSFYRDILDKLGQANLLDGAYVEERSDGKYEMTLSDGNIIDLRAWDNKESVIDTIRFIVKEN